MYGAGMRTSGFVGHILTLTSMGFTAENLLSIGILHLAGPALISLVVSSWMRRKGWIRSGDMFLKTGKRSEERRVGKECRCRWGRSRARKDAGATMRSRSAQRRRERTLTATTS